MGAGCFPVVPTVLATPGYTERQRGAAHTVIPHMAEVQGPLRVCRDCYYMTRDLLTSLFARARAALVLQQCCSVRALSPVCIGLFLSDMLFCMLNMALLYQWFLK